jgi:hypothetical protein
LNENNINEEERVLSIATLLLLHANAENIRKNAGKAALLRSAGNSYGW